MTDDRNLDKALDIVTKLIVGEDITSKSNVTLYEEFQNNSQVYDFTTEILKKMNLELYEYNNGLYASAGDNNRVFGYSNEELKKQLGLRLNKELFLCYFIIYNIMLEFYTDSATSHYVEFTKVEDVIRDVNRTAAPLTDIKEGIAAESFDEDGFKAIALLWDSLDTAGGGDESYIRSAKNSKTGYVKLVFNFLTSQGLFVESEGRYYPSQRFKALMENYFDEYKGHLYEIMEKKGEQENAAD